MLTSKRFFALVLSAVTCGPASGQAPRVATLDIEFENAVVYGDILDVSKYATSPDPPTPGTPPKNFSLFIVFGDIVSVNGKPAKRALVDSGRQIVLLRSPVPGHAISDLALRGGMVDIHREILQSDGTPVGSIMTSGFTGGGPPPGFIRSLL